MLVIAKSMVIQNGFIIGISFDCKPKVNKEP
jgi:hypothetical protein